MSRRTPILVFVLICCCALLFPSRLRADTLIYGAGTVEAGYWFHYDNRWSTSSIRECGRSILSQHRHSLG